MKERSKNEIDSSSWIEQALITLTLRSVDQPNLISETLGEPKCWGTLKILICFLSIKFPKGEFKILKRELHFISIFKGGIMVVF